MRKKWCWILLCWCLGGSLIQAQVFPDFSGFSEEGSNVTIGVRDTLLHIEPMGASPSQSLFEVGSLAKPLCALAVARLVDEGKLSYRTKVSTWIPEEYLPDNPFQEEQELLIAHLLEHSSGLEEIHFGEYFQKAPNGLWVLDELIHQSPAADALRWAPGSRPAYSNLNYSLLAYIVEAASGRSYEAYLQDEILSPLGMHHTGFRRDRLDGELVSSTAETRTYRHWPAMGLYTTANDLSRWLQFYTSGGRSADGRQLISEAVFQRLLESKTSLAARMGLTEGYTAGGFRRKRNYWICAGRTPGFQAFLAIRPDLKAGAAMLSNHAANYALGVSSLDQVYGGQPAIRLEPSFPLLPSTSPKAGFYLYANPRNEVFAFEDFLFRYARLDRIDDESWVFRMAGISRAVLLKQIEGGLFDVGPIGAGQAVCSTDPNRDGEGFVEINGEHYRQSGTWAWVFHFILLPIAKWVFMFSWALALGSMVHKWAMKEIRPGMRPMAWLAAAPSLSAVVGYSFLQGFTVEKAAGANSFTLTVLALSLLPLLLTGLSIYWRIKRSPEIKLAWKISFWVISLFNVGILVFMGYFGLIGLMLWR